MHNYLQWFKVDWKWNELSENERMSVRKAQARLSADPTNATQVLLEKELSAASQELSGREIVAALEDGLDRERLIVFNEQGIETQEIDQTNRERFESLRETDQDSLFPERLTLEEYQAAGVDKVARMLIYPKEIFVQIKQHAQRTDRSLSWMVQKAWEYGFKQLDAIEGPDQFSEVASDHLPEEPREQIAQTLYFQVDQLFAMEAVASRSICSNSQLICLAWIFAKEQIERLPSSDEGQ